MKLKTLKTKTFFSAFFTVAVSIAGSLGVAIPVGVVEALIGLTAIFLRDGISKVEHD